MAFWGFLMASWSREQNEANMQENEGNRPNRKNGKKTYGSEGAGSVPTPALKNGGGDFALA
jgi:hypothetical protein